MNITKENRKRVRKNLLILNISIVIVFILLFIVYYKYQINDEIKNIKSLQQNKAEEIKEIVADHSGEKSIALRKRIDLYEDRTPFKYFVSDNKGSVIYSGRKLDLPKKITQKPERFFYYKNNLIHSSRLILNTRKYFYIKTIFPRSSLGELQTRTFQFSLYKILALYIVVAYILSIVLLMISRINYNRFQRKLMESMISQSSDGVVVSNTNGDIIFSNKSFLKIFNTKYKDILDKKIDEFCSNNQNRSLSSSFWGRLKREGSWEGNIINIQEDGTKVSSKLRLSRIVNEKTKETYYMGIFRKTGGESLQVIDMLTLQLYDLFTGLPNRIYAENYMEKLMKNNIDFSCINICITNFKKINDDYGYDIGNKLLFQFIAKIKEIFGDHSFIARTDGKQISIITDISKMDSKNNQFLEDFLEELVTLSSEKFNIFSESISIETKIGTSFYPDEYTDISSMINHLGLQSNDLLQSERMSELCKLYQNKMEKRSEILTSIKKSIQDGEFGLTFQPKINSDDNSIIGAEALLTWHSKELGGKVSPLLFLPIAEESGYINDISEWTVFTACYYISKWKKDLQKSIPISLNISTTFLKNDNIIDILNRYLQKYTLDPSYIILEISESDLKNTSDTVKEKINKLAESGFKITLDNFGTGNSKFKDLEDLNLSMIKIDKQFIIDYPEKDHSNVIKIISEIAKSLDVELIGQGAEQRKHVELLRQHSCKSIQGYYYSKPVEAEELEKKIKEGKI